MSTTSVTAVPERLRVVLTLAHVLEKLERSAEPVGAEQYRSVVEHLSRELAEQPADESLQAILQAHPGAAELYENLNYQHAGLCRSPLDAALSAELKARDVIARVSRRASDTSPG